MKTILVIDDDHGILSLLETLLTREGYKVIATYSGREGMGIVQSDRHIDLIISDLKLSRVPGIDIVEEGAKKNIPAIMISGGNGTTPHIEHLKSLGYEINNTNFLYKPFENIKLITLVKQKLSHATNNLM